MKYKLFIFATLLLLVVSVGRPSTRDETKMPSGLDEERYAKELWEQAILAKGGRAKICSVRTLVVSSRSLYLAGPKDIPGHHIESLYVIPDKLWEWIDSRPGSFGLNIFVSDFGAGVAWELSDRWRSAMRLTTKPDRSPNAGTAGYTPNADAKFRSMRQTFREAQLVYLMETEFLKPLFVKARKARLESKVVDVLEGSIEGEKVLFYLDPKSHLPIRVVFITRLESGRDYVDVVRLSEYAAVSGILMPQRVSWGSDEQNKTTYQINVAYDPRIFEHPPTIEMGPEAWKVK